MIRIDTTKWRGALTRSAIVVLVFALLLEITLPTPHLASDCIESVDGGSSQNPISSEL
ncbi:MAG: hypothetical protein RXR02_09475 [Thermoproteus sp.]|jgi:hypothetical protein